MQAGFGDSLKLVGSLPETGAWDVAAAPEMSWCATSPPCDEFQMSITAHVHRLPCPVQGTSNRCKVEISRQCRHRHGQNTV